MHRDGVSVTIGLNMAVNKAHTELIYVYLFVRVFVCAWARYLAKL